LYVIGGETESALDTNIVEAYNPVTNTWTTGLAPMPTSRNSIRAVVDKGIIYVIGGYNGGRLTTVESYNPATNTWTEEAPLFLGVSDSALGLLGGVIVSAGGLANSGLTEDTEAYIVTKNSWVTRTASPNDLGGGCVMSLGGQLYTEAYGAEHNLFQAYSLKTNSWASLAPLPQPVYVSSSAQAGGLLYCFGGLQQDGGVADYVQIYTP
jgi:N-acetylneuraminic acid mutarotase